MALSTVLFFLHSHWLATPVTQFYWFFMIRTLAQFVVVYALLTGVLWKGLLSLIDYYRTRGPQPPPPSISRMLGCHP